MLTRSRLSLAAVIAILVVGQAIVPPGVRATNDIPHPDEFFGRTIGAPGVLIPHSRILEYYELLAAESDRVRVERLGETTMGRPFYYALVSSPENLARLDELIADNDKLYDPRGVPDEEIDRIVGEGVAFVIVNGQIHSTEVGASQGEILLAHRLATGDDAEVANILDNVVVAHVPVHNPDGQEMVIEWLDRHRGTAYQNSQPPFLYQKYTGHDNNRDWYMFTQVETQLSIAMQNRFHPQFTVDQHQQGSTGSRIFVPPFEDPWEPNVDPAIIASNNMIGTYMGQYLTTAGYSGVEWKQRYDAWTPARAYYHTHGGVRILTEVASADYADDTVIPAERINPDHRQRHWYFPMPWPGGTWRFSDVVDYHFAGAMAALNAAADLRRPLLAGMVAAQRRSVEPPDGSPYAFVFPAEQTDVPAMYRLLEVLRIADVDMRRTSEPFEADGRRYAAGSVVVPFAQPAGRFAKSVLERQEYPRLFLYEGGPLDPPYDVTAHTLPLLMNVRAEAVHERFAVAGTEIDAPAPPPGRLIPPQAGNPVAYLIDPRVNRSFTIAAQLGGSGLRRSTTGFVAAGRDWPAGTWIWTVPDAADAMSAGNALATSVAELGVDAVGVAEVPDVEAGWIGPPSVGIYQSYVPSMPEGWTRFAFEEYGIPFDTLHDADIRRGDLAAYTAIIIPPASARAIIEGRSSEPGNGRGRQRPSPPEYAGGIGEEGVASLRAYVEDGGTVFTWAGSTEVATAYLGVEVENLNQGLARTEFNIPGSLLRVAVDTEHDLGYGLDPETAVFYWNGPFFAGAAGAPEVDVVARYPESDLLLSGWIQGEEHIAGSAALVEARRGDGRVVLAGFSPEYRAQAHATFKVLFNAVFRPRLERASSP